MAEVDTSIYKDAVSQNPLDVQNKLLQTYGAAQQLQLGQQAMQQNQIKLATERFANINNAASGLLQDPDLGKKDVTGKLWDVLGRLTKGDAMSAQHAVQFMNQFPSGNTPQALAQQRQAIQAVHAQTLDAWQKGQAYLGQTEGISTGGGTKFIGAPAFGGTPQDRGFIPNTLQPGTQQVNPDLSQSYVGGAGNPPIQGPSMPAVNGAPARAVVPSTPRVVGDQEAINRGLYPAPRIAQAAPQSPAAPQGRIMAQPAPGAAAPLSASGEAYAKDLAESRTYASRMAPLGQAIPLLEKTKTGPSQEFFQKIGAVAQTLGLPIPNKDQITDYAKAQKYLAQNASIAAPPGTNIPSVMNAFEANPNMQQPNQAAVDLSKMLYGLGRLRQASVLAFKQTGLPPAQYTDWASKWSTTQDPRAYMADLMTPEQRAKLGKTIKPDTPQAKKFRASFDQAKGLGLLGDVEGHEVR
jgi:hypothetical protein